MKFIKEMREGERVSSIYLCKHKQGAVTKNGKAYENVILQDKTGTVDGKIWDPNSHGIDEFDSLDYIEVVGDVISFAGALQMNIKRVRKVSEGEYEPSDYLPVSQYDREVMYGELVQFIESVKNPWLGGLLRMFFVEDKEFVKTFVFSSAAKTVHHSFVGGLLEHTLSVVRMCEHFADTYQYLNRDLLISAAIFHDMGKVREISVFPMNDYTDDGQLLGHIVMGAEMLHDGMARIEGFPEGLGRELKHCMLAHHGELAYGSPKKPALGEAVALNLADNADAKLQTMRELLDGAKDQGEWLGYNRLFETNIRRTGGL